MVDLLVRVYRAFDAGLLSVLGRSERSLLAMDNPPPMIAEGAYQSIAFGILLLVDLMMCARTGKIPVSVRVLGAVAALGLMCIMANAYFTNYGNPACVTWQTLLLIVGNLAIGAALVAVFDNALYRKSTFVCLLSALRWPATLSIR